MDPSLANKNQQNLSFIGHVMQRKHSFIHVLLMGGVLLLSMKTAGQKYRINGLEEDKASLQEENESLMSKFTNLKKGLLEDEAAKGKNHAFISRLQALLSDPVSEPGVVSKK